MSMPFLELVRREIQSSLPKLVLVASIAGLGNAAILMAINSGTKAIADGKSPSLWSVALFIASVFLFIKSLLYMTITTGAAFFHSWPYPTTSIDLRKLEDSLLSW